MSWSLAAGGGGVGGWSISGRNEFVFRLNEGNVRNHTMVRLGHIIDNAVGKRLTYEELTR